MSWSCQCHGDVNVKVMYLIMQFNISRDVSTQNANNIIKQAIFN